MTTPPPVQTAIPTMSAQALKSPKAEDVPPPPEMPSSPPTSPGGARRRRNRPGPLSTGHLAGEGPFFPRPSRQAGRGSRGEDNHLQADWMIREFKTQPCGTDGTLSPHDHRCCPYFHNESDRRRPVLTAGNTLAYRGEPCSEQFDDRRPCVRGDACLQCHSSAELLYHPEFFRKRLCHQARRCPRALYCAFAHTRNELLVPHFTETEESQPGEDFVAYRFKTQWCPIGGPHDWEACVYAHTYRDWRRIPILGYSSHPCRKWMNSITNGPAELSYMERCPLGVTCPMAHGAKEQLYHPQFYKTSPCVDSACRHGPLCAFTHGEADVRRLPHQEDTGRPEGRPIPQAEEILRQYQPTYAKPPAYHALDESPRCGVKRNRNRRARGGHAHENEEEAEQAKSPCSGFGSPRFPSTPRRWPDGTASGNGSPESPVSPQSPVSPVSPQSPQVPQQWICGGVTKVIYAPYPPYYWVPLSGPASSDGQMQGQMQGQVPQQAVEAIQTGMAQMGLMQGAIGVVQVPQVAQVHQVQQAQQHAGSR